MSNTIRRFGLFGHPLSHSYSKKFFTEKFYFKQDGLLRDNCFEDGKYWSSYIISLTRKDYDANRHVK